ncbi:hypothetical protein AAHH78_39665, partial [Burkholderia pseudomallei]
DGYVVWAVFFGLCMFYQGFVFGYFLVCFVDVGTALVFYVFCIVVCRMRYLSIFNVRRFGLWTCVSWLDMG